MKRNFFISIWIFGVSVLNAQKIPNDQRVGKFEIGPEVAAFYIFPSRFNDDIPDYRQFQLLSGLFFRYSPNNFGLRAAVNLNRNTMKLNHSGNCFDCYSGTQDVFSTWFRIGGQYTTSRKSDFVYVFADAYYRFHKSSGVLDGGLAGVGYSFALTSNAYGINTGVGFKIRIVKRFYINPEAFVDFIRAKYDYTTTNAISGTLLSGSTLYFNGQLALRLTGTLRF